MLGLTTRAVEAAIRAGEIAAVKLRGKNFVSSVEVNAILAGERNRIAHRSPEVLPVQKGARKPR